MADPEWVSWSDEQLLTVRMCDLDLTIEGTDLEARIAQLNEELRARHLTFRPRFHAFLFGGGIRIAVAGHVAKLTGPKVALEIFRRYYRLQHHVQRVQQVLHDQRLFTDTRLKRVELRLRLLPEQFEAVRKNGAWLGEQLETIARRSGKVRAVRGTGLIWGLDVVEPANDIVKRGWDEGLLALTAGDHTLRILPPLVIDKTDLARGVAILEKILTS